MAKDPTCAELIYREAAILTALKHPLVPELRACIPGRRPSLATEYAGDGSLANFLAADNQGGLFSPNRMAKIITGIALGMRFVHSRGVIHHNLCPDNILLDWDWTVRIADFGWSTSPEVPLPISSDTPRHYPFIDPPYCAPECYDGTFTGASDVFSFGLIFFEILTGRSAFSDSFRFP
jgi:serine/threonine protein kinase